MKRFLSVFTGFFIVISCYTQAEIKEHQLTQEKKWSVEPIKITSLMVNTHPEYNGWGFEAGRRVTDRYWVTSMIEKTKGGDFASNFDPDFSFLVTFDYLA